MKKAIDVVEKALEGSPNGITVYLPRVTKKEKKDIKENYPGYIFIQEPFGAWRITRK